MTRTRRSAVGLAGAVVALTIVGCSSGAVPFESQQSGSLGLSKKTGLLYIADMDNGGVAVVDPEAKSGAEVQGFVATGERPERILVRGDDVFVANRRSRTVTHLRASDRKVLRQIAVGAEPMGLRITKDNVLVVANAMSGTVQAIDLESFQTRWTANVGEEVRGLGVLPDGRIYAPSFKSGRMHVIDGETGAELKTFPFAQPSDSNADFNRKPTQAQDVVVADDGRVYVPHSQTNVDALPPVTAGYYSAGPAPAVAPGVTTMALEEDRVLIDYKPGAFDFSEPTEDFPPSMFRPTQFFNGPMVGALDAYGEFLYVVNHHSNNVAVISTARQSYSDDSSFGLDMSAQGVVALVPVGKGPTGIAISPDQKAAYVHNQFDHSITVLGPAPDGSILAVREIKNITPQTLTEAQQRGRILFHSADDPRMTLEGTGGVSCASCHPNGREDGHTWAFAEGPRNTPSLVGKHLRSTKPYHWDGQFDEFEGFQHVLEKRMGGAGISRSAFDDILTYLDNEPAPDNPYRPLDGSLTEEQQFGRTLFEGKASCVTCHTGEALTDNKFYDVGTPFTLIPLEKDATGFITPEDRQRAQPNTPSLVGIFATGPFLHDGSKATLEDRVRDSANGKHGTTDDLTDTEVKALVAYLKTL